jgi:ubiquinone/menaquinone biosynthesis C-methylase UbiE
VNRSALLQKHIKNIEALMTQEHTNCLFLCLAAAVKPYKILDIGCGTGKSTEPLIKFLKKAEIVGCDPDKLMLKEARQSASSLNLPINYVEGRAEKLPFANDYFDAVIAGTAFHWFGTAQALKEIGRVLKKDGLLFVFWKIFKEKDGVVDWKKITLKYKWKRTSTKFKDDPGRLKYLFQKTGFEKIKIARIPFAENENGNGDDWSI